VVDAPNDPSSDIVRRAVGTVLCPKGVIAWSPRLVDDMPSVKGAGRPEWSWRRARGLQSNPKEESAGSTHHLAELPAGTAGYPVDLTDTAAVRTLFGDLGDIDHLVFTAG
jgi:hypothetical protein